MQEAYIQITKIQTSCIFGAIIIWGHLPVFQLCDMPTTFPQNNSEMEFQEIASQ